MAEYYFDIETEGLDPTKDRLCTLQFQPLSTKDGSPEGELQIWKVWEKSEEQIIRDFHEMFYADPVNEKPKLWGFVPIGNNLLFEFYFLGCKVQHYLKKEWSLQFIKEKPFLDVKHILIVMNYGRFGGYDALLGKTREGPKVAQWCREGKHKEIEEYVRREAKAFIESYQVLKREIPKIKLPFAISRTGL